MDLQPKLAHIADRVHKEVDASFGTFLKEFKDKMIAWKERQRNMSFQDWVETYTGTGRERGGTCVRPDIFLSWNNRACDGCECYEFCMCYGKRLSHQKRKPKRR